MKKETKIILAFLVAVLLFLIFMLWRQYAYIQRAQTMQDLRGQISQELQQVSVLRRRGPLTAADVSYIQSWMTFDYINTAFNIPSGFLSNYLVNDLGLSSAFGDQDDQYPHISISHYARENKFNPATLTTDIAAAVQTYLSASSTASATSTNELHP